MRIATSLASGQLRRKPLILFGSVVVGGFAAYQCAQYVLTGDFIGLAFAGMALVIGAVVVGILNNWRNGVYLFLSWLMFEDLFRKFLGNNMAVYFAKDFLLLVVFISFLAAYRRGKAISFRPPFLVSLLLFVWFGLLQIFNPASSSIWYGLMGAKIFFYYIPLIFVGYALFDSELELRRFFAINIFLMCIIASLGIAQSILGPTFLNPGNPAEDIRELSTLYRVSPITGAMAYRPTSVFVSTGRYADFLLLAWLLVLGFGGYLLLRLKQGRWRIFLAIALIAAGAFLTASRGTFMWAMINAITTSAAFIWGAPWRQGEALRSFRSVQRAALAIVLGIALLSFVFPDAFLSRLAIYQETLSPNSSTSELGHRTWDYPVRNFQAAFDYPRWPYGYGIGTTALGGQYVSRIFGVRPLVTGVESGFGALIVEMGIGGLALWIFMSMAIVFASWKVLKKLKGTAWFPLGFVIFWYAFLLFYPATFAGIQAYEDFVLNAYLWLLLGILFRLPGIKLSAELDAARLSAAASRRRWVL
ncbi:MAG: hypothetical protein JSS69_09550 [Acidobacteria bacterium]|nr:hypothetical protein [Acidobacteriota bacterium]